MNKLQKEAIAHYNKMIKWAKKQPEKNRKDMFSMTYEIGQNWQGDHCPYCLYYKINCPLRGGNQELFAGMCANTNCCDGLWDKMNSAKTWKTWIKYAEKVKQYIKENG